MGEILESYDFGAGTGRYNWDELFDGRIHKLTGGEGGDFTTKPSSLVASARKQATKRNMNLRIRTDGNDVVLQATSSSA